MTGHIIGVDVGGTFTDLVCMDERGNARIAKVPTTPENQAFGVLAAISKTGIDLAARRAPPSSWIMAAPGRWARLAVRTAA